MHVLYLLYLLFWGKQNKKPKGNETESFKDVIPTKNIAKAQRDLGLSAIL